MKLFKMLSLAVPTALTAMAFVGSSSAMAESTALCSQDSQVCPSAISHVHETTLSGAKAEIDTAFFFVECNVLFLGDVKSANNLGNPLKIVGNYTYTNCGPCTVTEINGPAEVYVLKLGHETADVTGEAEVHVVCGSLVNCKYNGVGLLGAGKGPLLSAETNGEVALHGQKLSETGGSPFCPDEATLDIVTTPLSATYISL